MKDALHAAEHAAMHRMLPPDFFAGLLAISADAVIAVDHEQRIIFFNEGAERIFGWSADDVGGKYLEILLPARLRSVHREHVNGFGAAHGRARLMGERQQLSGLRRNGEEFACEAAIQRMEVDGRNVYAAVLRDISARQRAEDALRRAVAASEEMLAIVSHDLRNPANAVKMLARSILDEENGERAPEHMVERVKVIQQAAEQIDALIQDLLDTTRLSGGRLSISPQMVGATTLVERSLEAMKPLAESARISLEADITPGTPAVWADPDRVGQLLSNLIGNAIKFTPPDGVITVATRPDGDDVIFIVSDTGDGIPAEELPHVFERFYQVRQHGRRAIRHGAGLGLPISRGIVEAHGGNIWIESTLGAGTTVRFTLPTASPAQPS